MHLRSKGASGVTIDLASDHPWRPTGGGAAPATLDGFDQGKKRAVTRHAV